MKANKRYIVIDFLKGIAIVGVMLYHLLFILNYFSFVSIDLSQPLLFLLGRVPASIFIFLVGFNLELSMLKRQQKQASTEDVSTYLIKRAGGLLMYAGVINVVTFIFVPEAPVYFGILHLIGTSVLLMLLVYVYHIPLTVFFSILILLQLLLQVFIRNGSWETFVLGYPPAGLKTLDYYPLLPWLLLVVCGVASARYLLKTKYWQRVGNHAVFNNWVVCYLGKHSLVVYLLHVPLIIALLFLLRFIWYT